MALVMFQNDPIDDCNSSVYSLDSVSVWATGGRRQVTINDYISLTELSCCQIVQTPVDNETKKSEKEALSRKRNQKAVLRCEKFLQNFLKFQPKNVLTLASIGGGNLVDARIQCTKTLDLSTSIGVALDGFHFCESNSETVFPVVRETIDHIPDTMLCFLNNVYQPGDILKAVAIGVDLFDGSVAYRLSRSGIAWLYDKEKAIKTLHFPNDDQFYSDDQSFNDPLQKGCTCHTCTNYNKAYVNHLHSVQEMLAQTLLMLHNSHQLYRFMQDVRESIKNEHFHSFYEIHKNDYFCIDQLRIDLSGEQPPLKRKNDKAIQNSDE
ncbi:Queuine tRNA-ribosyltransferase subunit qtrtd1 [Cichlidogyrus casuarinus]|uniref:Queuine tRNA-ribosyltransferase subunit qtrtd1 n=1 Tax=Cichlidogyrus casuarinus TaxID=1844966 RepID=A0ABD2QI58_9PLAT